MRFIVLNFWGWLTTSPSAPQTRHYKHFTRRVWWELDKETGESYINIEVIPVGLLDIFKPIPEPTEAIEEEQTQAEEIKPLFAVEFGTKPEHRTSKVFYSEDEARIYYANQVSTLRRFSAAYKQYNCVRFLKYNTRSTKNAEVLAVARSGLKYRKAGK